MEKHRHALHRTQKWLNLQAMRWRNPTPHTFTLSFGKMLGRLTSCCKQLIQLGVPTNNYAAPSTYGVLPLPRHNFSMPESWQTRRAYKVSYNAPLMTRDTRAVNTLFNAEMPAIRWLESHGYDIQYWTGVDAHSRGGEIAKRAKVYVSVGHDEYWSGEQRLHVEAARDAGSSIRFWQICDLFQVYFRHFKSQKEFGCIFDQANSKKTGFLQSRPLVLNVAYQYQYIFFWFQSCVESLFW